ncbi:tetratricopeptide repeat protein [Microcoleus sp. FACHB-672]|uniref:tetratricopeptide repeat protein n=1 Tax=Microcoleus sp. FACHB-672 TaxID=2692825 RepID=UPI00168394A1|nr:tetratricopeptide repeat protein [Microcoleus sp. FACHB-672]MBD2040343.1 tetratricopeptide repeat protein [Microcoleus sp. FACHB-672]
MSYLEKEYDMSRRKRTQRIQQVFAVVGILGFAGSMIFGSAELFGSAFDKPTQQTTDAALAESPLAWQARGYEMVLQREPENQTALEGLVNVRLQMKDTKGATAPLEKLIKLHPDRQDYKALLAQVKQPVNQP